MFQKKKPFWDAVILFIISAFVFLPNIGSLTYFKDDWYYIYDGLIAGSKVFHPMFNIDRPARGFFFEIYYSLFGPQPLPYHLGAFLWRVLAAIAALWLFNLLWPKERRFAFFAALLFALYPGYFWWISAIEYQPMIASLALQVISIAFTLKAVQSSGRVSKIVCLIGAILTGWAYIALVDYAIGMEVFRFLCVYILIARDTQFSTATAKVLATVKAWAWNLLIPFGFVFWRAFFFTNERRATDIGLQISGLFNSPLPTLTNWFLRLFSSLLNLGILAWVNQFPRYFFGMRLKDIASGLLIAGSVILLVILAEKLFERGNDSGFESTGISQKEAFVIGIPGMVLGILPVILANRYINLDGYSHYALPASLAAAVFLMGFIYAITSRHVQTTVLYAVIVFAALAHYGISVSALNEENAIEKFWWQVSWRVPVLRPGTTLVINYPSENIGDDGNGVMEAPNMIYFPQPSSQVPVRYNIFAVTLSDANFQDVLIGKRNEEVAYRSHTAVLDYGNILVMSQPTATSCVHVIDGNRPLISTFDPGNVMLVAPSSNIENVIVDADPFMPQSFAFGSEPEHKWCYYYEKAELALQMGNWDEAAALGEEAIRLELHPHDRSEWLPFLYGYAVTGNEVRVKQTAPKINADKSLRLLACNLLTTIKIPVSPEMQELISTLYCKSR